MSATILSVEGLSVSYGEARALVDVSFDVAEGSVTAVLGPNGAGKSSLAAAIAGLVRPSSGRVVFAGRDVAGRAAHRISRNGLAYLPEQRGVFPHLSVIENLRVQLRHAAPRGGRDAAIEAAFERFPVLAERRSQAAGTLSGGEQQMLALARVLVAPPRVLVADEMSFGLAPKLVDMVFESLERARDEGVTIVLIEQYVERALELADDAVILQRGTVVWRGPASGARDAALAGYLGELPGE